jgi:hypothetical protein
MKMKIFDEIFSKGTGQRTHSVGICDLWGLGTRGFLYPVQVLSSSISLRQLVIGTIMKQSEARMACCHHKNFLVSIQDCPSTPIVSHFFRSF